MYVTEEILQEYLRFYAQKSARKLPFLNTEESKTLSTWFKAFIERNLYQNEAFYPTINTMDEMINRSL
jgi:hypothetical protein